MLVCSNFAPPTLAFMQNHPHAITVINKHGTLKGVTTKFSFRPIPNFNIAQYYLGGISVSKNERKCNLKTVYRSIMNIVMMEEFIFLFIEEGKTYLTHV